ncbi:MAG: hypothetical protein JWO76_3592 [Nocardioides sp.]|nr:hypothetical protein [Nocardioides sp.]
MTSVEELRDELRHSDLPLRAREVAREEDLAGVDKVNGMTVFRTLPDGGCETWVWERGEQILTRSFQSESAAVDAWREPQPARPRTYDGPLPTTVEELKDALAATGREPDEVARAELLLEAPKPDGMVVVEKGTDGAVTTYTLDRGQEHDRQAHPDEAAAVAAVAAAMRLHEGRQATDKQVARMWVHADQHRRLVADRQEQV